MDCDIKNGNIQHVVFSSSVENLKEVNRSFAKGTLRIAYHGDNRNGMCIPKSVFEDAIHTAYNCPIVCNYNRESDSIGAHDIELVKKDNRVVMVNVTTPVGVVPESANMWWEKVDEDNGETHEYLCSDIYVWKRQEEYQHLVENGITDESMEIHIIDSVDRDDGVMVINKFEFLAFCLLESAEPCFESAGIELFSLTDFKAKYAEMMDEFKSEFSKVMTASADDINNGLCAKGGKCALDVNELMRKYSLSAEDVDFDMSNMSQDEIEERFAQIQVSKNINNANEENHGTNENEETHSEEFSLTAGQIADEIYRVLRDVKYQHPDWGEMTKYYYVDHDTELCEVYAIDAQDGRLYGFTYSMNGDNVVVDFGCKKRKKVCYADFDDGDAEFSCKEIVEAFEVASKAKISEVTVELESLRAFKRGIDEQKRADDENNVFSAFEDLSGNDAFEALKTNCKDLTIEQIEEKCFAIRGRSAQVKFSLEDGKPIRIPVEHNNVNKDEPYGGVFAKYGIGTR